MSSPAHAVVITWGCGNYNVGVQNKETTWWRHQMETFSALLVICAGNSPVPGEFPTQRPVTRSFDVFFGLRLNQRLSKQSFMIRWFTTSFSDTLCSIFIVNPVNYARMSVKQPWRIWIRLAPIKPQHNMHEPGSPALGWTLHIHYNNVIMWAMASQITSLAIVCSTVYSGADHRKHQSSASLAFVRGIHRWPVNSPHKGPVTRKMFPFDDVIMKN